MNVNTTVLNILYVDLYGYDHFILNSKYIIINKCSIPDLSKFTRL